MNTQTHGSEFTVDPIAEYLRRYVRRLGLTAAILFTLKGLIWLALPLLLLGGGG